MNSSVSPLQLRILNNLRNGSKQAIKGKELARLLGYKDDRKVRLEIRELIRRLYPIGSSTEEPAGYFLIDTPEEATRYMAVLKSRLVEDAYRLRDIKVSTHLLRNPEQLTLEG